MVALLDDLVRRTRRQSIVHQKILSDSGIVKSDKNSIPSTKPTQFSWFHRTSLTNSHVVIAMKWFDEDLWGQLRHSTNLLSAIIQA